MAYKILFILLVFTNPLNSVLAETGLRGSPAEVESGKKLYQGYCQSCHGLEGVGEPPVPLGIRRLE